VLAAAAAILAALWERVPSRWAVHWGAGDRPDGWADKSVASAATPLLVGLGLWGLIEALVIVMRRHGRDASPPVPPALVDVHADFARGVGLAVAAFMAALAVLLPLVEPRSSLPIVFLAFALVGGALGLGWLRARRRARALREKGVALPEGWDGLVYRNAGDERLWVPKLTGLGWTLNFAHRAAWPVLLALVGAPILIVTLLLLLRS
jgi:uncharacterized membrane protein